MTWAPVGLVLEETDRVIDLLDADDRWWSDFDDWEPTARRTPM